MHYVVWYIVESAITGILSKVVARAKDGRTSILKLHRDPPKRKVTQRCHGPVRCVIE